MAPPAARDPLAVYSERGARFAAERERHAALSRRISTFRLVTFLAAVTFLVWAEAGAPAALPEAFYGAAVMALAFLGLVAWQSRVDERQERAELGVRANDDGLARLRRDWRALPEPDDAPAEAGHPYARDLDVVGHASLLQLLGAAVTDIGRRRLRAWLLQPDDPTHARARQSAVHELAGRTELRQAIEIGARRIGALHEDELDRFLDWAESGPWLRDRPLVLWSARLLPWLTAALIALQVAGTATASYWLLPVLAGGALTLAVRRRVHGVFHRASLGEGSLRRYADLLRVVCFTGYDADRLKDLQEGTGCPDIPVPREVEKLAWLAELADLRHNGIFWLPIHALTLWDFHVLASLERWKASSGARVRGWIDAVAELDALNALGTLAFEEPGWCFPEIVEDGDMVLEAEALAHPLLPATRVPNDIAIGPPGTFLMVTGSNMSGKTTLLRATGANAVLGRAGGPVCATRLRLPAVALHTSMRVEDSLEEGISLFIAELQRIKSVVDAAERQPLLYLFDEVLHGTNTAERQIAVRRVIAHLLDTDAIGAIATHDLELAEAEPLRSSSRPVHFQETVEPGAEGPAMSFDYRLRPGIATSTNALKLVEMVGLD